MLNIQPTVYNGERVLLSYQLAEAYGVEPKLLTNNYLRNREKYVEGVHYHKLTGEILNAFKEGCPHIEEQLKFTSKLYLWTEKGCLLHSKSLNTDVAWEVYDTLIDTYFKAKDMQLSLKGLSPQLQVLINIEMQQQEMNKKIDAVASQVENIRSIVAFNPTDWREETNKILNRIGVATGNFQDVKREAYDLLKARTKCNLNLRLKNKMVKATALGLNPSVITSYNRLDVIEEDVRLKEVYIAIVKELAIKYNVA